MAISKASLREIMIGGFPVSLRRRVIEDAKGSNMNAVIVRILGEHYSVTVDPTPGRPTQPSLDYKPVLLRLPQELNLRIRIAAAENDHSPQDEIVMNLCAYYGLSPKESHRSKANRKDGDPA